MRYLCGFSALILLVSAAAISQVPRPLFVPSDQCMACHNSLITATGNDVSIGFDWRPSMMANSSRDPYWKAGVRREIMDHPGARAEIENECAICHMPMAAFEHRTSNRKTPIFSLLAHDESTTRTGALASDGVSCTVCHQITDEGMGLKESFTGHFAMDPETGIGQRKVFGRYEIDSGRSKVMSSATGFFPEQASHIGSPELCATCHTLYTHALDEKGNVLAQLPEQVPYLEWRHSRYRTTRSCQACHMPAIADMPISSVLGQPRTELMQHVFRAGNFFMPRIFARHGDRLRVAASPKELNAASQDTISHLQTSAARLEIADMHLASETLTIKLSITNLAGHKLPTAYPSRRVWLHMIVKDREGKIVFESGKFRPDGSIAGNDNDADPGSYEPHYDVIDNPEKVQVYESMMVDREGRPTTGLLSGVRYVKDNRILPEGFDKHTADPDVAVQGAAAEDRDFGSGADRITYMVPVTPGTGPYTIEAELWYQPIAYRWAQNLRDYTAAETERFVSLYESMSGISAAVISRVSARMPSWGH